MKRPYPAEFGILECTIQRDKTGVAQKMYPKYALVISGCYKYLLSAKKVSFLKSAHYIITLSKKDFYRGHPEFIGKLRSNGSGNEYNIFDNGENPSTKLSLDKIRTQLGSIIFVYFISNLIKNRILN